MERPKCARCAHYFITYDPRFPYGCRAMKFKSRSLPQNEVEAASGMPCQTFQPRQATGTNSA
jgi:hypothetical protein